MKNLIITFKTISQLGLKYNLNYFLYQLGLISGHYRRVTPVNFILPIQNLTPEKIQWPFNQPNADALIPFLVNQKKEVLAKADEIVAGHVRLFDGPLVRLNLTPKEDLYHWTDYERGKADYHSKEVKLIWEPARFGWVFPLARAYLMSNNNDYAQCFWRYFEEFTSANPFNLGPNWTSAQEIALRLIALTFAGVIFKDSPISTQDRMQFLLASIYMHAKRIPPTLCYAKAQNNNHLISEAVGLYNAAALFVNLPEATGWRELGWKWFNYAIATQIDENGEYIQHSTNYHRLMLHQALWMMLICKNLHKSLPTQTLQKLNQATKWLLAHIEPINGCTPNLGHNDGSNILPLSGCSYADMRPAAQAASQAFLGKASFPTGPWDELCIWLDLPTSPNNVKEFQHHKQQGVLHIGDDDSHAYLQAAHYKNRPAHADQLHVDLWFEGHNLTLDAGTYLYNALSPWENSLAGTRVHNTVTINDQDQMTRAGRFLWLDWAQAKILKSTSSEIIVEHNGYKRLGIIHRRKIEQTNSTNWIIVDTLIPIKKISEVMTATLHWLLPDWQWAIDKYKLSLYAPFGLASINVKPDLKDKIFGQEMDIIRAGKSMLLKTAHVPILGWYSPTYNLKIPALSFYFRAKFKPPIEISTFWQINTKFPETKPV